MASSFIYFSFADDNLVLQELPTLLFETGSFGVLGLDWLASLRLADLPACLRDSQFLGQSFSLTSRDMVRRFNTKLF